MQILRFFFSPQKERRTKVKKTEVCKIALGENKYRPGIEQFHAITEKVLSMKLKASQNPVELKPNFSQQTA